MAEQVSPSMDVASAYERYFPLIREKCRRMLKDVDEAQDVAQETFIRLWRSGLLAEGDVTRITAWIYSTSTRSAIDRLRRSKTRARAQEEIAHGVEEAHQHLEQGTVMRQQLERLAKKLSRETLELLVMERLDGLGQAEIAEVLGVSTRTIRRLLERAERTLSNLSKDFER